MKRMLAGFGLAIFIVGMMALPAAADVDGVGAFNGTALVGKNFLSTKPCTRKGEGVPDQLKGLYLPAVNDPTQPQNRVWSLSTGFTAVLNSGVYTGNFNVCGWLDPGLVSGTAQLGSVCGSTKGHDGQGQAHGVNQLTGQGLDFKVFNLNWKETPAGVIIPVAGNYEVLTASKAKTGKQGTIIALVGVAPVDPLACATPKPAPGATQFNVAGAFGLFQPAINQHKPGKDCKGTCPADKFHG